MQKVRIYHNPNCSKSRAVLEWLEAKGLEVDVIQYLDQPLTEQDLQDLLAKLDLSPRQVMRTDVTAYQEHHLADKTLSDADLIATIVAEPALLNRPIVVTGKGAALCRPIEVVETLL